MAREYVPIFFDWLDTTQDLSAEEKGNLIDAVVSYASGKEFEHLLTGGCKIAFRFLKGQVDRNNAISEARSKAGSNKPEQTGTNANKAEQNGTKVLKEKEKEKDKENKKRVFIPPTVDEVAAYCRERNNNVNPERFVAFYGSKGWKVGNQPMKDWKLAVITWEKRDESTPQKKSGYEQRDYSKETEDALNKFMGDWGQTG